VAAPKKRVVQKNRSARRRGCSMSASRRKQRSRSTSREVRFVPIAALRQAEQVLERAARRSKSGTLISALDHPRPKLLIVLELSASPSKRTCARLPGYVRFVPKNAWQQICTVGRAIAFLACYHDQDLPKDGWKA
jgi:hypothetical protein